jgi:hypothetical protein
VEFGVALERPELIVTDSAAWRMWLSEHRDSDGVRLVLAKKGTLQPTSLTHREALEEALCFGWIDGHHERPGQAHAQTLVLVMGSLSRPAAISSEAFFRLIVPSLRTLFDVASPGRRLAFFHADTLPHARR